MKKLFFIIFAALLFGCETWAGAPVSTLKVGHYYRIRNTNSGHYLCWAGQEGVRVNNTNAFRQPMILVSAEKALTSPGTIFQYGTNSSRITLTAQGVEVGAALSNYYVAFENAQVLGYIRATSWGTNSTLILNRPVETSKKFNIETSTGTTGYWEENWKNETDYPDGYLNVTTSSAGQWLFEEVDGSDAKNASAANNSETKNMESFLGFPPVSESYNVKFHYIDGSSTVYGTTNDGPRQFQISDVQAGQDEGGTTWYYATMCLPFPVEVPDNVHCFFVDENRQTVAIEYNEGNNERIKKHNVIPAGTPFVARSSSNNPVNNKFTPFVPSSGSEVFAPNNASVNALIKANSYLVKKAKGSSRTDSDYNNYTYNDDNAESYRLTTVNGTDVEFADLVKNINSSTNVTDGNRAFYGQTSLPIVYEPEEAELADLIYQKENGEDKWTDKDYVVITDPLEVCYINEKAGLVFARDKQNNKNYWEKVTSTPDNYYNFRPEGTELLEPNDYNQSNWVIIRMPSGMVSQLSVGMTIPGGKLKGSIQTDKIRPIFNMVAVDGQSGQSNLDLNTYSIAHLMAGDDHLVPAGANAPASLVGKNYFFMTPKPVEVAHVTWAVIKKMDNGVFAYIPKSSPDGTVNGLDFHGRVLLSPEFYAGNTNDWNEESLQALDGQMFNFLAAITKENGNALISAAPRRAESIDVNEDDPISSNHVIYPLEITQAQVITAVEGVNVAKTVKSVKFYNLQGMASDTPQPGVNIVVELFDDGTTRSSKMVF